MFITPDSQSVEVSLEEGVEGEEEADSVEHWAPIFGTVEEVGLDGYNAAIKETKNISLHFESFPEELVANIWLKKRELNGRLASFCSFSLYFLTVSVCRCFRTSFQLFWNSVTSTASGGKGCAIGICGVS